MPELSAQGSCIHTGPNPWTPPHSSKSLVPSSVANATPESLWGSVLVAATSAAAVLSTIKGILGGSKRPEQQQGVELVLLPLRLLQLRAAGESLLSFSLFEGLRVSSSAEGSSF